MQTSNRMMKNQMHRSWTRTRWLAGLVGFVWLTGCQSLQYTSFAPVEARLERVPGGGAQHLVIVNTSGQELHNCRFRAYMWDDRAPTYVAGPNACFPKYLPRITYTYTASESRWETNGTMRFSDFNLPKTEGVIFFPVSRLEIVGRCDEGRFREEWQINLSGQLQLIGPAAHPAQP